MADTLMQIEMDTRAVLSLLDRVTPAVDARLLELAQDTAERIAAEAQRRVAVASGATREGIVSEPMRNGRGYIVRTLDARPDSGQLVRSPSGKGRIAPQFYKEKHVALWLEKGTEKMIARPFFEVSAEAERGPHVRRVREALQDAIDGLGG